MRHKRSDGVMQQWIKEPKFDISLGFFIYSDRPLIVADGLNTGSGQGTDG